MLTFLRRHLAAKTLAVIKSQLRAILGVAAFALLKAWEGGGLHLDLATAGTALSAALLPVLLRYLDPAETAFGHGSAPPAADLPVVADLAVFGDPLAPVLDVAPDVAVPAPAAEDPVAP